MSARKTGKHVSKQQSTVCKVPQQTSRQHILSRCSKSGSKARLKQQASNNTPQEITKKKPHGCSTRKPKTQNINVVTEKGNRRVHERTSQPRKSELKLFLYLHPK